MNFLSEQISAQDAAAIERQVRACAHPNMVAFELGTYTGRSAVAMLPCIREMNGHLFCVDWFRGNVGVGDRIGASFRTHNILSVLLQNLKEGGWEDCVTVMVGTTDTVASVVADNTADFIFVDADHRYEMVQRDILNWYPKLKLGGVMCGHDFDRHMRDCNYTRLMEKCHEDCVDGCHYGVIRAVCEFFPDVRLEGRIWYSRKERDKPLEQADPSAFANHAISIREYAVPLLIEEFEDTNIVRWMDDYYGLPKRLGHIDLRETDASKLRGVVCGRSLAEAKDLIRRRLAAERWPEPVGRLLRALLPGTDKQKR